MAKKYFNAMRRSKVYKIFCHSPIVFLQNDRVLQEKHIGQMIVSHTSDVQIISLIVRFE